jgi:transporter family-2 protein
VSSNSFAAAFCVVAGLGVAFQAAMNSALARRVGATETALLAGVVTTALLAVLLLALRGGTGELGDVHRAPAWMWLGGIFGTIALGAITYAPSRIGVFATLALFLGGQLAMGLVIDAFGLLEAERTSVTATRITGLILVVVGAALVLRR